MMKVIRGFKLIYSISVFWLIFFAIGQLLIACNPIPNNKNTELRERSSLNKNWKFFKYEPGQESDQLIYDVRLDGTDLSFITVQVQDKEERIVPQADNLTEFSIEGSGEIVATDNGDPTDLTAFPSHKRKAFNGLALAVVQSRENEKGTITIHAKSAGLNAAILKIVSE